MLAFCKKAWITKLIIFVALSFLAQTPSAFSLGPSPVNSPQKDIEELDENDEESIEESRFGPEQAEIRDQFQYAGAIAGGEVFPWQLYTIELIYQQSRRRGYSFFAGGGHFSKKSNQPLKNNYDIEANTYSFGMSHRLFLTEVLPVALVSVASIGSMSGSLSPRRADVQDNRAGSDFLSSSFRCYLATIAAGLTVSYGWTSGMVIEWNVLAAHKSWALQPRIDRNESERLGEMRKFTDQAKLYGVMNLKIGYYFK